MKPAAERIINELVAATNDIISGRRDAADYPRYTLHSHTEFCDGRAQMEAFARRAVADGFEVYGFSPHSPVPIESSCNMTAENAERYSAEFDRIAKEHGREVTFLKSMEIDYLGPNRVAFQDYCSRFDLDYAIGSVHFIPAINGQEVDIDGRFERFRERMARYFNNDIHYVVNTFFDRSLEMVREGGFDIIGHFDKIGHNADHFSPGIEGEGWYQRRLNELIEAIIASNLIVEINTKALAEHNRFFPTQGLWRRLADAGVRMVVNSDAHVPALIDAGRSEAFKYLSRIYE